MLLRSGGTNGGPALGELHRRLKWVALVGIVGLLVLAARLWQLQVMRGEGYFVRTVSNVVKERYLTSVRGKLLDRNNVPLADNRPAFSFYVTPRHFTPAVGAELARLLGLSDDELQRVLDRVAVGRKRDARMPIVVLEDQGRDRAARVEQALGRLPGVEVRHEPYRYYPQGALAAHLIGYMTQMTADEADRFLNKGYDPNELVGRYGLELAWENYLRGKKGIERYAVDARGQRLDEKTAATLIQGERVIGAVPGANVILTIDAELQRMAEKAVAHVPAAAVVIVEPRTGKLRAVVSRPSFDPNVMTGHLTKQEYELLRRDPRKPFVDKALRATYPPGSVFKFVTALAALEDHHATEDEGILCTGAYELSGTTFKCNATHGKVDLIGAIQKSCNVYFWKLAERIGLDRIAETARLYGFGVPTNLGLNGDAGGRIPTKAWYEQEQHVKYKIGYATNAATGQGDVEVSPLQMAMAYGAIANGGTLWVPQVVERIEASDGSEITSPEPKIARDIKVPADALDIWRRGMWKVTNEAGGTAFDHGYVARVPVMGKTGTAEIRTKRKKEPNERNIEDWHPTRSHAWFAGYAPAGDPEIVILVFIEHGGSGGRVAWPIAKEILEGYFTKIHPVAAPEGKKPEAARPAAPAPAAGKKPEAKKPAVEAKKPVVEPKKPAPDDDLEPIDGDD
ncbi:MAG: penicillin-binding protein 2 [Deltaproteobacteria bacterium]|nr:penicillin-binding protein 2 [Deltaproteobacteria bacterium]